MRGKILNHLALFSVALIYGATYSIMKPVTDHIPPMGLVLFRIVGATVLLTTFHQISVREKVERKDLGRIFLCMLFGIFLNQVLFVNGLSITQPINGAVIMILTPVMVLIASSILLGERLTRLKILGITMGAIGVFWIIGGGDVSFRAETVLGDLMILGNATCYGLYLVLVKPLMVKYHALTVAKWLFLFGCLAIVPFGLGVVTAVDWATIPPMIWGFAAFIVIAATFLVYLLNGWALREVSPSLVGFYIYLQPVLATIIAVLAGTDKLTTTKVFAAILIFSGVYVVSMKPRQVESE